MASIRKLKTGYRAEVARKGVRKSKVFATRRDAKEWATRVEYEILNGEKIASKLQLGEVFGRYAREVSPSKRGARWETIRLEMLGRDSIAKIQLEDLSTQDFADWRDRRLKEVAPASVIRELQLMSSVLNTARREWGLIKHNFISDVSKPKKPPPRDRLPTQQEVEALRHCAGEDLSKATARAFHAFLFAMETAMRAGEIAGLERDCVDVERRVAHLKHTKNGRPRDVPLSSEAIRLLQQLPDADPVFGLSSRQLDVLFRKSRDKAQIENLTFHDSRHAAITALARKLDVLALARMVGHTDLRMLQVYYNESAEELAKRLD
ncbi:site-specific integrase [Ruegeria sp. 2205SS24-7]|uniref:tyrosine-type recombinase/integrase n=1 Tax=Ruegeria discodermiae TaxID=3064389 RepID=UPI0027419C9B|nr:site-specific integrase [Ruegeria sp. 2205SS24-7]MDP5216743.1 site-specific integrase [Ruegeria sp. 2205SS24-7]